MVNDKLALCSRPSPTHTRSETYIAEASVDSPTNTTPHQVTASRKRLRRVPSTHNTNPLAAKIPSEPGNLWCGDMTYVEADHAELGLVRGCIRQRPRRGQCEIRGRKANLWGPVARALGFNVVKHRYANQAYNKWLYAAGIDAGAAKHGVYRLRPGSKRRGPLIPDIVFSDVESLPLETPHDEQTSYWRTYKTPHVFFVQNQERPNPPAGWQETCAGFNHATLGGATTAHCSIYCWFP